LDCVLKGKKQRMAKLSAMPTYVENINLDGFAFEFKIINIIKEDLIVVKSLYRKKIVIIFYKGEVVFGDVDEDLLGCVRCDPNPCPEKDQIIDAFLDVLENKVIRKLVKKVRRKEECKNNIAELRENNEH